MLRIRKFVPDVLQGNFWVGKTAGKLNRDMDRLFGDRTPKQHGDRVAPPKVDVASLGWSAVSVEVNLGIAPAEAARVNAAIEVYKAQLGMKFLGNVAVELDEEIYPHFLRRKKTEILAIADRIAREEYDANKERAAQGLPPISSSPFRRAQKLYTELNPEQTPPPELIAPADLYSSHPNTTYFFAEGENYPSAINNMHGWLLGLDVMTRYNIGSTFPDVFGYYNQLDLRQRWQEATDALTPFAAAQIMLQNPAVQFNPIAYMD